MLLQLIIATPQLNFRYTDWVSQNENIDNNALQHHCLRVIPGSHHGPDARDIMHYCMSEWSLKFNAQSNIPFSKFTFDELSNENITSQHLYLWSVPIDIIERYQFYLNQITTINDRSLAKEIFYNCTMPRFGPMCQYELVYYHPSHSSLNHIIGDFYRSSGFNSDYFTCYTHLKCNRGPSPSCLDWSEICNGQIDCLDDGIDEEHCWQLEINECNDDEYRCINGQCVSQSFYRDDLVIPDCVDRSDESTNPTHLRPTNYRSIEPSFGCEDISCTYKFMKNTQTALTSSCDDKRTDLLIQAMYSNNNNSVSQDCWSAFKCLIEFLRPEYSNCHQLCEQNQCKKIVMITCPDVIFFPNIPVLFGNIYFAYRKTDLQDRTSFSTIPLYICYNTSHYDAFFINITKISLNNMTCTYSESFLPPSIFLASPVQTLHIDIINELHRLLMKYHLPHNYNSAICNRSNMYQCLHSSKCISIYRLMDNITDCPHVDDENMTGLNITIFIKYLKNTHYKCQTANKYIHQTLVENMACHCETSVSGWCEDENLVITYIKTNILFQYICDGYIDISPAMIEEWNGTDETECEQWQCNNIYTRCDYVWNCPNGVDESGCMSSPILNCSTNYHLCVTPDKNQLICLPVEKANDGHIDCLGATDEPSLCISNMPAINHFIYNSFYCMNYSSHSCIPRIDLCDGYIECEYGDDEQFCRTNQITEEGLAFCTAYDNFLSDIERFFCDYLISVGTFNHIPFILGRTIGSNENQPKNIENAVFSSSQIIQMSNQNLPRCHRGLDLRVWLDNKNNITYTCLCPPSFYGDRCQYQNQRISLAIRLRALSNSWQILFAIVISLIDDSDQRIIHSYEQFTYLSVRDCPGKFNLYLLYSTRPKDLTKNYSIHIDLYNKELLKYRGSVLLPIYFPFLPVHRLAFLVDIPRSDDENLLSCSNRECIYGKCIKYVNNPDNLTFCKCDEGWSGRYCTIQHTCICANDSLCIGVSANNRSICVCPLNKFGSRCLLNNTACETNINSTCKNGGQCISDDDYLVSYQRYACICPKGYSGLRCEIADTKIILSFDINIIPSQSISIHFIYVYSSYSTPHDGMVRMTTMRAILLRQDSVTIYWGRPFHLVFTEFLDTKTYYLTWVQKIYNQSVTINKMISSPDRCPNITELFNETFLQWHPIRRIKYYHLPCQNQSLNLSCFHDNTQLCLCYDFEQQRMANCFKFDHNLLFDCMGRSECEHGGQCLQDDRACPTRSVCICSSCFYGKRCEFTTSGFGLSLDAILGYHIIQTRSLTQQSFIIKMSLALTIIFIVIGFFNSILCLITFKNKIVREVGCGLYLFGSSITTLLIMFMFGLKFLILILAQMTIILNKTFLKVQCHSMDFLLQVSLYMDQWLNACVALERVVTAITATRFDKKKSRRAAKFVILILLVFIGGTSVHDPIYRHLSDDENDVDDVKRTWCIVRYPSSVKIYNYIIHAFHFFGSFLINLLSSVILIIKKSRQQATIHKNRTYKKILREQFHQHKHLLTAPIVLVILALPRLIITFVSKCIKSADDAWLFLVAYFISFIPPMLTFFVFIYPSKFYKTELRKSIRQYRSTIQRRLHLIE